MCRAVQWPLIYTFAFVLTTAAIGFYSGDDVWRPGGAIDRENETGNSAAADDGWGSPTNDQNEDADGM